MAAAMDHVCVHVWHPYTQYNEWGRPSEGYLDYRRDRPERFWKAGRLELKRDVGMHFLHQN